MLDLYQQPRWGAAYQNRESLAYKLPVRGLFYPLKEVEQSTLLSAPFKAWDISETRKVLFVKDPAQAEKTLTINTAETHSSALTNGFRRVYSLEDLKFSKEPCYYFKEKEGYYINRAEEIAISVTDTNSTFDLDSTFTAAPHSPDSYFLMSGENSASWERVYPNEVNVFFYKEGTFNFKYLSQDLEDELIAGTSFLELDGNQVDFEVIYWENSWDNYTKILNLIRPKEVSNSTVKLLTRKYVLSRNNSNQIAISLFGGYVVSWNTFSGATFNFSGKNSFELIRSKEYETGIVNLVKYNDLFYTQQSSGYWESYQYRVLDYDSSDTSFIGRRKFFINNYTVIKDDDDKIIGVVSQSLYPKSYLGLTQDTILISKVFSLKKPKWGLNTKAEGLVYEYS